MKKIVLEISDIQDIEVVEPRCDQIYLCVFMSNEQIRKNIRELKITCKDKTLRRVV